jgi:HEAT repeat protein
VSAPARPPALVWYWLTWILVFLLLIALGAWWGLPRWAPDATMRCSPWPDPAVRASAVSGDVYPFSQRIAEWGPAATPALLRLLRDSDPKRAGHAMALLPYTSDPTVLPVLEAYALEHPPSRDMECLNAIASLAADLHDEAAIAWLVRDGPWGGADHSYSMLKAFQNLPPSVTALAVGQLAAGDERSRSRAALALCGAGGGSVGQALLAALDDPAEPVRNAAGLALNWSGAASPDVVLPLFRECADDGKRAHLMMALQQHRMVPAVAQLIPEVLRDDPASQVRVAALRLAQVVAKTDPLAAAAVVAALDDVDPQVRRLAAGALGNLKELDDGGALARRLADSVERVRAAAAYALAVRGDARAIDPLFELAKSSDRNIARQALNGLGKSALPLDDDQRERLKALRGKR